MQSNTEAFTLIELSIVLVIIGLLAGGVMVGLDLMDAAKERKHISQVQEFQTAVNTFKLKYNALPGDFKDGGTFFPTLSCGGGLAGYCYGNGNRILDSASDSRRVWAHLAAAGLWPGTYFGGYRTTGVVPDYDVPISALKDNMGMDFVRKIEGVGSADHNYIPTGHYLHFGSFPNDSTGDGYMQSGDTMLAEKAWRIDRKIDDGVAKAGKMQTWNNCASGNDYQIVDTTNADCYFWHYIVP